MIKLNIFEKIYEIMEEYEKLMNKKKYNINYKENNLHHFFEKDFFQFIYQNIKINKENNIDNIDNNDIDNNNINKNNSNNDFDLKNVNNNINVDDENNILKKNIKNNLSIINSKNCYNDNNNNFYKNNNNNNFLVNEYIKKLYKKIILICHPDKNGDKELFIKCQEYYNNNFLIGILYIGYKIRITFPQLNKIIVDHIFIEIRIIQEKIKNNQI